LIIIKVNFCLQTEQEIQMPVIQLRQVTPQALRSLKQFVKKGEKEKSDMPQSNVKVSKCPCI